MQDKTFKRKKVPRIKVRVVWMIIEKLKEKMCASLEIRFRQACFGDYLNIKNIICQSNLLLGVAQRQIQTDNPIEGISYSIEYTEDDCLRICLLMMVESFKGTQEYQAVDDQLLNLVDNLEAWNQFPWGTYLWPNTCTNVYNLNQRYQSENKGFSLPDCVWPFKVHQRFNFAV
ncbi:hypothetical protein Hanom_Chr09g00764541 [Helianthus anomalus]